MVEERVVEVERPVAADRTVVVDGRGGSGGTGWIVAVVLVIALLIGGYYLSQMSNSRAHRDNAIADAAKDVGNAAEKAGNAVAGAADNAADSAKR